MLFILIVLCAFFWSSSADVSTDKSTVKINCPLPDEWRYELTLTVVDTKKASLTTDGIALKYDHEIYVNCQIDSWTFMNRIRNIEEHPSFMDGTSNSDWWGKHYYEPKHKWIHSLGDYIDSFSQKMDKKRPNGSLIVQCKNGVFNPDIFTNYKNWCAEGCPKIPYGWLVANLKDVVYPKGSLSLDSFKAPVQRLLYSDITFYCHYGFAVTKKTKSKATGTVCGMDGYDPSIYTSDGDLEDKTESFQICKKGCENPQTAIPNSAFEGKSATSGNGDGLWQEGKMVTMACKAGYQIYGTGYRQCFLTKEKWKDLYGQSGYDEKGLYWDPTTKITYCKLVDPNANVTSSAVAMQDVWQPSLLFITVLMQLAAIVSFST